MVTLAYNEFKIEDSDIEDIVDQVVESLEFDLPTITIPLVIEVLLLSEELGDRIPIQINTLDYKEELILKIVQERKDIGVTEPLNYNFKG